MIEAMTERAHPLTRDDIDIIQANMDLQLPPTYKDFLLTYNGGRPKPNAFPIKGLDKNPFGAIQVFFGIDDPIQSCTLDWNYETMNGRLPTNLLAIACTGSGDLICLSLFGDDAGSVVFWDSYNEPAEPSYENVYRVADTFTEFIDSIRELPDPPAV